MLLRAASAIGRVTALRAAARGARLVIADRDAAGGEETVALIGKAGSQGVFVRTDVSSEADARRMVDTAISPYGRLDGAFNNAALPQVTQPLHEMSLEARQRALAVNWPST